MDEKPKQRAIRGRDCFNEWISSLRDKHPLIKEIQDVMNDAINRVIYDNPNPYVSCEERLKRVHRQHEARLAERTRIKNIEIKKWKDRYNEEKAIPKRPNYCKPNKCPFKPNDGGGNNKKKLSVSNGKICYGDKPIKLCGVSRWEALWRETEEFDSCGGWGQYSLAWYENELKNSGINYVRHAGIKDTQFLYDHCKRLRGMGIFVETTVFRAHAGSEGILVNLGDMGELAKLGNVFFDVNNEFLDRPDSVSTVIGISNNLKSQGCIVSAGAWSGERGKTQSITFHQRYNKHDVETHHRDWNPDSFKETLAYRKPVVWNEYFAMKSNLTLEQVKSLMREAFACGVQGVNYYGFRFRGIPGLTDYDDFDYKEILNYAGRLAKGE